MTIAKPIAKPLLGLLILAALAVYAAISINNAVAPAKGSITIKQRTQSESQPESRANTVSGQSHAAPSQADTVQKPSAPGSGTSVDTSGHKAGNGVTRFADAGPDVVGPAAPQGAEPCGPKPCPQPLR